MKGKVLRTIRNIFDGVMIFLLFITTTVYALPSDGVTYDGSTSGSSATNVNDALNDLYSKLKEKQDELDRINNIGNAASNHILNGYTAYVKGKTVTGSIPSKGATTYTPGTANQTIAAGQYLSGIQTIKGDANLVAGNIAKGKSIFGINGTYTSDANAVAGNILSGKTAYVNGSKITGSMPNRSNDTGTTGLSWPTNNYQLVGSQLRIGINAGYYGSNNYSNWGTPGIAIENIASKIGLTAAKLAKGQTVLGVAGSYTSDATATAADIASGKTAYVNGSKITGTSGGTGKILKEFRVNQNVEYSFTVNENVSEMILIGTQVQSNYLTVKVNGTVISGTTSLIENQRYGTFHFNNPITSGSTISVVDKGGSYTYFWAIKLK